MSKLNKQLSNIQHQAVDIIALTPNASNKEVSLALGVHENTILNWRKNALFNEAIYDRFVEITGDRLPLVILSMFREAEGGNVQAARLILEHYNKLDKTLHIKIHSPFEKFLGSREISHEEIPDREVIELARNIDHTQLPDRDPEHDQPQKKIKRDKKRLNVINNVTGSVVKERKRRNNSYHLRQRAMRVGLELLPPGRQREDKRRNWLKELERREKEMGINKKGPQT